MGSTTSTALAFPPEGDARPRPGGSSPVHSVSPRRRSPLCGDGNGTPPLRRAAGWDGRSNQTQGLSRLLHDALRGLGAPNGVGGGCLAACSPPSQKDDGKVAVRQACHQHM